MALSALLYVNSSSFPPLHFAKSPIPLKKTLAAPAPGPRFPKMLPSPHRPQAFCLQGALSEAMNLIQSSPPTWRSAFFNNLLIFTVGSPILVSGLSLSGICAAFLLGTLTWRAFGPSGFLLVASYFVIGTAATKVKMAQKEAQGVAEKRKGRRGPGSVIGSSAAVLLFQFGRHGQVSVTTFKVVPRGTEGAVSVEGTLAGLLASILLASIGCFMGEIRAAEAVICVIASQIANFGESIIGASLQGKEGFQWVGNDINVYFTYASVTSVLSYFHQFEVKESFGLDWPEWSVDPLIVPNLKPYKTTKAMWDYLKNVYNRNNTARHFQLENDIANYSKGNPSIQEYFSGFKNLWAEFIDIVYAKLFAAQGKGKVRDMNNIQCYSCKEYGHIAANCGKKFCNYCKQLGHIIKECPTPPQNHRANASSATMNSSNHFATPAISTTPSTAAEPIILTPEMVQQMIVSAFSALGLQGNDIASSQFWLVDFAASNHMTNSSSMLKNVQMLFFENQYFFSTHVEPSFVITILPTFEDLPSLPNRFKPGFKYERRQPTLLLPETDLPPAPASEPTSEISSKLAPPEPILCRSTRVSRPPNWYGFFCYFV
ncbi:hypothetical protein GH714_026337 [Hevea brasiliensis]|uniref:CCHC-type domain-containing protein n=1 Tax=Hevea brasiliensis TaxID=3981 RepID=A0A6A6ML24_HEVBR|nr:hypothetical protein GH714_026337 [Hevea brasiliensis]